MGRRKPSSTPVGRRIAEARRAAGMTQGALAKEVGLDRTGVSKIESGRRRVSSTELDAIARALGRPIQSFLTGNDAGDPSRVLRRKRAAVLKVARKHGARSVRVFGSVARGEAAPGSDIDLLVEMQPGRGLFAQAALLLELQELLGVDVDVVSVDGLRGRIRERVLAEAVSL